MDAMYVVFAMSEGGPNFKVFSHQPDASAYAATAVRDGADTADVYRVDGGTDARAAKAALEMGEGHFVEARGRAASDAERRKWLISALGLD